MIKKNLFDKHYYLTSCGIPYDQADKWEHFFGEIADRIVRDINPGTVLDAGCAYGYLVAALRDRGVDAYGIDISEYAISQVREDIKPFCKAGSVLDPLPMRYDLIISIEVMEHMQPAESRKAIENLCNYTDDLLFTSTPFDFKEATHFNVQPTEYWISLFANNSFFRDTDFDASFIVPHAIRFRKQKLTIPDIARNYEKVYFRYYIENKTLRDELIRSRLEISQRFNENESTLLAEKNQAIGGKDIHISNLDKFLQERDERIGQLMKTIEEKEFQIGGLHKSIDEKSVFLQNFKEELIRLDLAHLKAVEKGDAVAQLEEHIRQLDDNIRTLSKLIREKDVHELNFQEVSEINDELNKKIRNLYFIKEEKEKALHSISAESSALKTEISNRSGYTESLLSFYKAAHTELERIRKLKGYKLLWKYYELRDRILLRKIPDSPAPVVRLTPEGDEATTSVIVVQEETILEKEVKFYSRNPIYNLAFSFNPMISIVVPVFNTPLPVLTEMINSVISQTYPHFELILADAGMENPELARRIHDYTSRDKRVTYTKIENKGIAANTNTAIRRTSGEFIAFLDHDDTLAPHALFEIVYRLQNDPHAYDFFYSDKDMMPEDGKTTCNPLYKPQWSPEIMFSANYLTHFCVIRKALIENSGFLDSHTDGAQDWDIFLKVSRLTSRICHIPQKLYHWRILETSVASGIGAKPYALQAQITCLQNHFAALKYNATIGFEDQANSILKVSWHGTENNPVTFIINHSGTTKKLAALIARINSFHESYHHPTQLIVLPNGSLARDPGSSYENITIIERQSENIYDDINRAVDQKTDEILVFISSELSFEDDHSIHELVSWAAQDQYGIIVPKIIDKDDIIVSAGIVINNNCILNVFQHVHSKHYTVFGHTEWYRNVTAGRLECFAVRSALFKKEGLFRPEFHEYSLIEFCLRLQKAGYRHVYIPFSTLRSPNLSDLNAYQEQHNLVRLKKMYALGACDPYWNPNLLSNHTIPTENKRKVDFLSVLSPSKPGMTGWEKYSADAFYMANEFDFSTAEFEKNADNILKNRGPVEIRTINWILPHFDFIYYAGLYTIFRLANHLQSVEGVQNTIVTVGGANEKEIYNIIIEAFPLLRGCKVVCLGNASEIRKIPYADASICSLWTTAYYLLRFNNTKKKFYFIQDYEPLFYPAGSTFGQTDATYTFGFYGIANTQGLRKLYEEQYNGKAIDLKPCIDGNIFYPSPSYAKKSVSRVFFYGRPGHPRNGFELGATALKILKSILREKVEIYCAGSDWDPAEYGLSGIVINMGRMDFEKTADLYRICDAGLVMMFTKHPSYLPFELMACGCAVVSNYNKDTTWFLKDGVNCLLTEASATRIAETLRNILSDEDLRNNISRNALLDIRENHAEWDNELSKIYRFMCSPDS